MSTRRTDDTFTHTLALPDGTVLCFRADHGRTYLDYKIKGSRSWSSNVVQPERMALVGRRASELAAIAPSTRRSA